MCGACGERGTGDWARPWIGDLAARRAVATAVLRPASGTRVSAGAGGWLVTGPTGAAAVCDGLSALVAAVRARTRGPFDPLGPLDPERPSGRLSVPPPDRRPGVILRIAPDRTPGQDPEAVLAAAIEEGLAAGRATGPDGTVAAVSRRPVSDTEAADRARATSLIEVVVAASDARAVLAALASPRWLPRCHLAAVEGTNARWGRRLSSRRPPETVRDGTVFAADVAVRLEWERQSGRLDGDAVAVRWPLGPGSELDVEIRDGHVVRARTLTDDDVRSVSSPGAVADFRRARVRAPHRGR